MHMSGRVASQRRIGRSIVLLRSSVAPTQLLRLPSHLVFLQLIRLLLPPPSRHPSCLYPLHPLFRLPFLLSHARSFPRMLLLPLLPALQLGSTFSLNVFRRTRGNRARRIWRGRLIAGVSMPIVRPGCHVFVPQPPTLHPAASSCVLIRLVATTWSTFVDSLVRVAA